MQPLVKGALAVAVLAAASALAPAAVRSARTSPGRAASSGGELMEMPCGPREIPEGEACVPVPAPSASGLDPDVDAETDDAPARLPRRPDRPAKISALLLPIAGEPPLLAVSGPAVAVDDRSVLRLGAPRGTPAHAVALDRQEGPFEILGVERLPGRGLVVGALATLGKEAPGKKKSAEMYVVLFGSLDGAGPGLERGTKLVDGGVVGFAGDSAVAGEPCLRFEARRLRPETDPRVTPLSRLVTDAESIATDARNVLPARGSQSPPPP